MYIKVFIKAGILGQLHSYLYSELYQEPIEVVNYLQPSYRQPCSEFHPELYPCFRGSCAS